MCNHKCLAKLGERQRNRGKGGPAGCPTSRIRTFLEKTLKDMQYHEDLVFIEVKKPWAMLTLKSSYEINHAVN